MPDVHVRRPDTNQTYCGTRGGETLSLSFWHEHVVPNRDGCCAGIYRRLCRDCDKLIPLRVSAREDQS